MKYVRIFLLHWQQVFEYRGRSFVWFLIALLNPLLYLLFWYGTIISGGNTGEVQISQITSYYLLLIIAGSFLHSHVEEPVALEDIQQGALTNYLLRPFSYYWLKFIEETPYRILQGGFGVLALYILSIFLPYSLNIGGSILSLTLSIIITLLAYFIMHTFKMTVGLSAFWFTDSRGFQQLIAVILLLLGGFVVPLNLLPDVIYKITLLFPFAYMIYMPIVSFQGGLTFFELFRVVLIQCFWLLFLWQVYRYLWKRGLLLYTNVGR